ncbi:MAG: JAB domain-containing protein [Wolbachia sp.]|nr:JAB domain-containing protein [Wolbachia sp.]
MQSGSNSYLYQRDHQAYTFDWLTSIVISHNHPSGDVKSSSSDISLTKQLAEACQSIGIKLVDHIIIEFNSHFSFKENQLL